MEREVKIRTRDKKWIYGMLRGSVRRPVIVFVHGLTGHMDEHAFYDGVRFFERHGFSSFRFNLYDWRKGARRLSQCTLRVHACDLDRVIEYLRRRGARRVFVVGHSYGGPTILLSKQKWYDGVVLWDPSIGVHRFFRKALYVRSLGAYVERWGVDVVLGRAFIREAQALTSTKLLDAIRTIHAPIKIITAGKGMLVRGCQRYYAAANPPKTLVIIRGADHNFNFEGNQEALFRETLAWLKRWA